jgi:hypothetical protein
MLIKSARLLRKIRSRFKLGSNSVGNVFGFLRSNIWLILTNASTAVATIFAVIQYQSFPQIHRIYSRPTSNGEAVSTFINMSKYSGEVIYLDLLYKRVSFNKNLLFGAGVYFQDGDNKDIAFILKAKRADDEESYGPVRCMSEPLKFCYETVSLNFKKFENSIYSSIEYGDDTDFDGYLRIRGAFYIDLINREEFYSISISPPPATEKLGKQISCMQKDWSKLRKSLQCPLL